MQKWIVAASLLVFPITGLLAMRATTNTQDLRNWIDTGSKENAFYQEFRSRFVSDDEILVSWPGCTDKDPRLVQLTERLRIADREGLFDSIINGAEVLADLRASPSRFSDGSARRRLRGALFADDLTGTCVIARLSNFGSANRQTGLNLVRDTIADMPQLDARQARLAGKAVASVALDELTNRALLLGIPGSILAGLVSWLLIGSWRQASAALYVSGLAALIGIALVRINGTPLNGLLVLMPVMVFVLTLGGAFHLTRAFQRELAGAVDSRSAVRGAIAQLSRPVAMSMLTTAIGIASLGISAVPAVRQFGLYSAAAILIATLLLLVVLPACWSLLFPANRQIRNARSGPKQDTWGRRTLYFATARPAVTLLVFALLSIPAIFGIFRLKTDLDVHSLFDATSRVATDKRWFEEHLFPMGRVELLVQFPRATRTSRYTQLVEIRKLQGRLRQHSSTLR